jgi:3-oxoadipate enol-lactonase
VNTFPTGPRRWKLCSPERSRITKVYRPRLSVATLDDPFFKLIVEPGPTVPMSLAGAAGAAPRRLATPNLGRTKIYPVTSLILLHGIGTGPSAWEPQIEALSGDREVLAPDLVPAYRRGLEAAVDEVRRIASVHRPVALCGLSLGAVVALRVAAERFEEEDRLVVCAGFDRLPPGVRRRVRAIAAISRFMPQGFLHRQLVSELPEPHRARALHEIASLRPRELSRLMWEAAEFEVDRGLIVARTLVLCGERDKANLPLAQALARAVRNSTFALVPDAGHVANLDNPAAFTTLLDPNESCLT